MTTAGLPPFLLDVVSQLRRRQLALGLDDLSALRSALRAGFGWRSSEDLRELCVALWATTPAEATVVRAAFLRAAAPQWQLPGSPAPSSSAVEGVSPTSTTPASVGEEADDHRSPFAQLAAVGGLGAEPPVLGVRDPTLVLVPQYPLAERELTQLWRRLRRPRRDGPPVDLDVGATVAARSRRGVATPPVLVPRRRNVARLLLLVDRGGSMTPYHGYVDTLVSTLRRAARLDDTCVLYFHDVPGQADRALLDRLPDPFAPELDAVLPLIPPLTAGRVYTDPQLQDPADLIGLLARVEHGTAALVVSDAGAVRQRFDTGRLLDSLALVRAVKAATHEIAWVNPAPPESWTRSTAGQLARHVPMFPLTRVGLGGTVDVLRGRPATLEHPL